MDFSNLAAGNIRKIISGLIGIASVALCIFFWYKGGFMTVSESYKVEEIPIHNTLYILDKGDVVRQGFQARDELLTGIEVMLVNTSPESDGNIVVQVLDMWADVLGESRLPISEVESGVFVTVPLRIEMNREGNEEFQICIFSEGASIAPAVVLVPDNDDFEDNTLCYYNEDLVGDQGLVVGYDYGHEEFVGYKWQKKSITWITTAKIIAVLLIGAVSIYFVLSLQKDKIKQFFMNCQIFCQLTIISFFVEIFFFAAIFNKITTDISIPAWAYGAFFVPLLLFLWSAFLFIKHIDKKKKGKGLQIDPYIFIIILICLITRLPLFRQLQRWDSAIYYIGIYDAGMNFDFSFESVWNYFRLASHPTFAYIFFMLIGEFLFPAKVTGVLIVNLFMTMAALVFIYKMFRGYWCSMPKILAIIFTIVISVTPLFWGTFSYINVDYTLILFFVYLMYAEYKEQKIMMTFWSIALFLNKETGWPIVMGYYMAYLIKLWKGVKGRRIKQKIAGVFRDGMVRGMVASLLVVCVLVIQQGGLTGWLGTGTTRNIFASREAIAEKGTIVHAFGFYPEYIVCKFKQIFILNFMWIPTLIIITSIIYCIVKHTKGWKKISNVSGMVYALVMFVLFNILYITAALSRYTIFSTVILWLIALILLYYVWEPVFSKIKLMAECTVFIVLLTIQTFVYIDPFSNVLFNRIDSGKGTILSTYMDVDNYSDSIVNNYRYSYLDNLLDKMLIEVDYDKDMQIVLWPRSDEQSDIDIMSRLRIGWNKEKKKRVLLDAEAVQNQREIIPFNMIPLENIQAGEELKGETILYFLPYYERDEEAYLSPLKNYYYISERKEVSSWGGTLYYYVLTQ